MSMLFIGLAYAGVQGTKFPDGLSSSSEISHFPESEFCTKSGAKEATGVQFKQLTAASSGSSCSSTAQGVMPSIENMVSTLITAPENGAHIDPNQPLVITLDVLNLDTGFFADADKDYYLRPQTLGSTGNIQGHQHVTIQLLNGKKAPIPKTFAFFKGIDDVATSGGATLGTVAPPGTFSEPGTYRICSLSGSFTHQPVIMPVARRGAQDDCIRVHVKSKFSGKSSSASSAAKVDQPSNAGQPDLGEIIQELKAEISKIQSQIKNRGGSNKQRR